MGVLRKFSSLYIWIYFSGPGPEGTAGCRAGLSQEDELWRGHDRPQEKTGAVTSGGNTDAHMLHNHREDLKR